MQLGAVVRSIWGENAQNIGGDTRYKKSDIKRCVLLKCTFANILGNELELVGIFTLRPRSRFFENGFEALGQLFFGERSRQEIFGKHSGFGHSGLAINRQGNQ